MSSVIFLNQVLEQFNGITVWMPLCLGEASTFIVGGLIDDTQIAMHDYPNVYEGSTRPGTNSQILKVSLNFNSGQIGLNQPKLEFIDE